MNSKKLKTMITLPYQSAFDMLDRLEQQFSTVAGIPSAEILEDQDSYIIRLELAGADKESIDIKATDRTLIVTANRKILDDSKEVTKVVNEFRYESWKRMFTFSNNLDRDKLEANYKDGILEIKANKTETHTSVTVNVND